MAGARFGVIARVDCAHHLDGAGICESVHGHTFTVEVLAEGAGLDLDKLEMIVKAALNFYDHKDLNTLFAMPTCEVFCQALFDDLKAPLPGLCGIKIWEGHGQWAEIRT